MVIQCLDYFGSTTQLRTFGKKTHKTGLGASVTVCSLILISVASVLFGRDFYLKETPRVFTESISPEVFDNITMTPNNFNFMFRLEDKIGNFFDFENKLNLVVSYLAMFYNETNQDFEFDRVIYSPDRCSNQTVIDINLSQGRNLSEWFCLNYTDQGLSLGGSWSGSFVYFWNIGVNNCLNDNSKCFSELELKDTLKDGVYFSAFHPQNNFSPGNFDMPLTLKYVNQYTLLNTDISYLNELYFRSFIVNDDRGWIFKDTRITTVIAFDYLDKGLGLKGSQDGVITLYSQSMYLNSDKTVFHRNFMKIQELAALIGGFMKIIIFIAETFVNPYSRFLLNQRLMNLILSDDENSEKPTGIINIHSPAKNVNSQQSMLTQKIDESSAKINNYMNKHSSNNQNKDISLSFWKYMWSKYFYFRKSKIVLKYELSLQYLHSKLDLAAFLTSFRTNELFFSVFLNENQLNALYFMKKFDLSTLANHPNANEAALAINIVKYYKNKQKERTVTELDYSIFCKLSQDLKREIGEIQIIQKL